MIGEIEIMKRVKGEWETEGLHNTRKGPVEKKHTLICNVVRIQMGGGV